MRDIINRIIYGKYIIKIDNVRYLVESPNRNIYYKANEYYLFLLDKHVFDIEINDASLYSFLLKSKLWSNELELLLTKSNKDIQDLKEKMYDEYIITKNVTTLERELLRRIRQRDELYSKRHCLDHITVEGFCRILSNNYIIKRTVKNLNTKKYLKEYAISPKIFHSIIAEIKNYSLGEKDYRAIARDDYWHNYWVLGKERLFGDDILSLSEEQKQLLTYSKMYDSIRNHPEAPEESVINNDYLLDGWMIKINKKSEGGKLKREIDNNLNKKTKNASEVGIITTRERAADIFNMNTEKGKAILQQRQASLDKTNMRSNIAKATHTRRK